MTGHETDAAETGMAEDDEVYLFPSSFGQRSLWFIDQSDPESAVYNLPVCCRFRGALDVTAVGRCLDRIVERHEVLRTTFRIDAGEVVQVISPQLSVPCHLLEVPSGPDREADLTRLIAEAGRRPFELESGPLLRAEIFRIDVDDHVLLVTFHHIVSDEASAENFLREMAVLYAECVTGEPASLTPIEIQYADYAAWQRETFTDEFMAPELAYWKRRLAGLEPLDLPTDRPRPRRQSYHGAIRSFEVSAQLTAGLSELGRRHSATLFMVMAAAVQILLYRYSRQPDIALGFPVAGRDRPEMESMQGYLVNTLVLRTDFEHDPSVATLIEQIREETLQAIAHRNVPFERVVEEVQGHRDPSYNPLFQVMLLMQSELDQSAQWAGLAGERKLVDLGVAKFDLSLLFVDSANGLDGMIEFNTDLFDPETIERLTGHLLVLLEGMVAGPEQQVSRLPLLGNEQRDALTAWNATSVNYPQEQTLVGLFEAQVARTPMVDALVYENQALSYEQLNQRANQLARVLIEQGVGRDALVGVLAERSFEMVVSLLAVLKAGGAYVPLDPSYPSERLGHMLEDAQVGLVLAQPQLASLLPEHAGQTLLVDDAYTVCAHAAVQNPDVDILPRDLAYVIFTSGSTGRPKGAMNEHRGICNRLLWMQQQYRLGVDDRVLQKTPYSFDVSVWEFFWPLMVGARLVIARPDGHRDSAYLAKLIRESAITTLHFVPSMLQVFLDEQDLETDCASLKRTLCSGEALPRDLQERFFARLPAVGLHNLYGPTEAAVDVTFWECRSGDSHLTVPIGRPVANTQMHVLDRRMQPVPVGVAGELYIGGVQVGRGYIGRDELTAERFVPDPFSRETGARLYRTGDLARYRRDGAIEYLGRLDFQVKLRGQRIEPGEIEATLDGHAGVGQSVVMVREDVPGNQQLVAYVVGRQPLPTAADLKEHLMQALPAYMVPGGFVFLDALPLTSSGKVDRRALPEPQQSALAANVTAEAPSNDLEIRILSIWHDLLGSARAGVKDAFFDAGGNSLLLIRLSSLLESEFGTRIALQDLLRETTVARQAMFLSRTDEPSDPGMDAIAEQAARQRNARRRRRPSG